MLKALRKLFQDKASKRHSLVGNPKYWKLKQDFQIDFLKQQGLKPESKLLDIGCGTLRGGIPLIKFLNTGNYYGLEVRKEVLDEGIAEAKEQGVMDKAPHLVHFSDFQELALNTSFDVMFAFSVLIHMTDEIVNSCIRYASENLAANGVFYANVNLDSHKKGQWQGFPVMHKDLNFYQDLAQQYGLSVEIIGRLSDFGHHTGDLNQDHQSMLAFSKK